MFASAHATLRSSSELTRCPVCASPRHLAHGAHSALPAEAYNGDDISARDLAELQATLANSDATRVCPLHAQSVIESVVASLVHCLATRSSFTVGAH
eukprot:5295403-Pleurochrysis_carterae.AAC.1